MKREPETIHNRKGMVHLSTAEFVTRFVLAALAVWRLTHLLALEDGPGDVVVKLRTKLGDTFWGRLMDCFYCLSLWVAAPFALFVGRTPAEAALSWLAISGAACLLEKATTVPVMFHPPKE